MMEVRRTLVVVTTMVATVVGFHDCIQHPSHKSASGGRVRIPGAPPVPCSGGLCVGMHGGPHEGGPASYPVGSAEAGFTSVRSTMTVPDLPKKLDGICYYIWYVWLSRSAVSPVATRDRASAQLAWHALAQDEDLAARIECAMS
jgi:hypothetical protein